jgi:hypothetical protein
MDEDRRRDIHGLAQRVRARYFAQEAKARRDAERHERFLASGNPMHPSHAYLEARSTGEPVPDWVMAYLDEAFRDFWSSFQGYLDRKRPNEPEKALAKAFKISDRNGRKTGRGTIWTEFSDTDWIAIGADVMFLARRYLKKGRAFNETALLEDALERFNADRSPEEARALPTARRAWSRYQREFPDNAAEFERIRAAAAP